jgi:hypothetical protein
MAEHDLDLRLRAVALALDADAPAFDASLLTAAPRRRARRPLLVAVIAAAAVAGVVGAPAAVSAFRDVFGVESVPVLEPDEPGVAGPYLGDPRPLETVVAQAPFPLRTIGSLGPPSAAYLRADIPAGMVMLAYDGGRIVLTQWPSLDVRTRVAVVPVTGTAEETSVGRHPALWAAGQARGTFTLIGADGGVHKERFELSAGALLWQQGGVSFLLQGAGTKEHALLLAAEIGP